MKRQLSTLLLSSLLACPMLTGAASADLLAGNVSLMIETITNAQTLGKTGKVSAIAVLGDKRLRDIPEVPIITPEPSVRFISVSLSLIATRTF